MIKNLSSKACFSIYLETRSSLPPRIAGNMNAGSSDERGENDRVTVPMINRIVCIQSMFLVTSNREIQEVKILE